MFNTRYINSIVERQIANYTKRLEDMKKSDIETIINEDVKAMFIYNLYLAHLNAIKKILSLDNAEYRLKLMKDEYTTIILEDLADLDCIDIFRNEMERLKFIWKLQAKRKVIEWIHQYLR